MMETEPLIVITVAILFMVVACEVIAQLAEKVAKWLHLGHTGKLQ